ncbi:MAG: RNA polymerase sigma factor [Pseudomonadota bacterium]
MTDDTALRREIVTLIPRLRRFALGLTGSQADADDLVQTALEKALNRLDQFKPGTRLDSWLFRIVQTSWIDNRRSAARREDTMDADMMDRIPGRQDPGHADALSIRDGIQRALDQLADDQRSLAVLVLVEGYSYQEAADMEGVPIGTVMSRLSRARKTMASFLGREGLGR